MGDLPVYSVKSEKEEGPLRTLHRDLLLPCGFLPEAEGEEQKMKSSPKRSRTRQKSAVLQGEERFASDDNSYERWYTTATLPDVTDRRFVKEYQTSKHKPVPVPRKHSESPAKPHPSCVNVGSVPGVLRPNDVPQPERERCSEAYD